jgi:hypothetical protein
MASCFLPRRARRENVGAKALLHPLQNLPNWPVIAHIGKDFLAKIRSQAKPIIITTAVAGIAVTQ